MPKPLKIVFLTQYYPPETGAPQNRLHDLAQRLQTLGAEVKILTALPNYPQMQIYSGYQNKWWLEEEIDGVPVTRSWIFVPKSKSIAARLLNYFSFVFSSLLTGLTTIKQADYILCESPPLFLGISALLLARLKGADFIFNISDLWPESAEKLGLVRNKVALKAAAWLERLLYQQADLITGQTQGIITSIRKHVPEKPILWLKNGVAPQWLNLPQNNSEWRQSLGFSKQDFIILYAGILGYAQGLNIILEAAQKLPEDSNIRFVLIGEGPLRQELSDAIQTQELQEKVRLLPSIRNTEMPNMVSACNAAVVPLRNLELFRGAIPSKIFENLACGKPILLGVDGEARELFVKQGKCALFFTPENSVELAEQAQRLSQDPSLYQTLSDNAINFVSKNFNRASIAAEFWNWLQKQNSAKFPS